ncbi:hypothetical protein CHS0354_034066 [Potamilus streckersoni]|uniref:TIR domain-containing protein n=1 Tax=Potamilus streckersoni TaxID=2493646 RepID=A0AAE0VJP1_9BIVA|nr:hypothetical protein CHS0354_034066 [Potamilus streckersoni]
MKQTIILCSILLLMYSTETCVGDRVFRVPLDDDTFQTFSYESEPYSECIYNKPADTLYCMDTSYRYSQVTSVWTKNASSILYISVNCLSQSSFQYTKYTCFCKTASTAANRQRSRDEDEYTFCHLNYVDKEVFLPLSAVQVIDLSNNRIVSIQANSFVLLDSLTYIDISRNQLTSFPRGTFCDVRNLRYVFLKSLRLTSFPSDAFSCGTRGTNITVLDLSQCLISDIQDGSLLSLNELKILNISRNLLTNVTKLQFQGAPNLRQLDLSYNQLDYVFEDFCEIFPRIRLVSLKGNRFKVFDFMQISDCHHITEIDLSSNQLLTISTSVALLRNLRILNLANNNLGNLTLGSSANSSIENLNLSNNTIAFLSQDSLEGMVKLKYLNLSYNSLEVHENFHNLFSHTRSLESLDLSFNNLTSLAAESFVYMQNLTRLNISYNQISNISEPSFKGLSSLLYLDLLGNNLTYLPSGSFGDMNSLEHMDLSNNMIESTEGIEYWPPLVSLKMKNNRMKALPIQLNGSRITELYFQYNNITKLKQTNFDNMKNLLHLDISNNNILSIDNGTFISCVSLKILILRSNRITTPLTWSTFKGLNNLVYLDMAQNEIAVVSGIITENSLKNVEKMDLSHNAFERIDNTLKFGIVNSSIKELFLQDCSISQISQTAFAGLKNLLTVNLERNKIQVFQPFATDIDVTFLLFENPLQCSCEMSWIADSYTYVSGRNISTHRFRVPDCKVLIHNFTAQPHYLEKRMFLCAVKDNCDNNCACFKSDTYGHIDIAICRGDLVSTPKMLPDTAKQIYLDGNSFEREDSLNTIFELEDSEAEELYLNNSKIRILNTNLFLGFFKLRILDLQNNMLRTLPATLFNYQTELRELYLGNNQIGNIPVNLFKTLLRLEVLDLSSNRLVYIEATVVSQLSSISTWRYLYFSENQWKCDCWNVDFKKFVMQLQNKVVDRRRMICSSGKVFGTVLPEAFLCPASDGPNVSKIAIAVVVSLVVFAIINTAVIYYRREVCAILYKLFGIRSCQRVFEFDKPYDALIVYDVQDQPCSQYTEEYLLPKLKSGQWPYNIAVANTHQAFHLDDTKKAMEESKSSLFIISDGFLNNTFCNMVFDMAVDYSRVNKKHKLILLVFGDLDLSMLNQKLQKMFKKGDYITARSHVAWIRLVYELPESSKCNNTARDTDQVSESDVIIFSNLSEEFDNDTNNI